MEAWGKPKCRRGSSDRPPWPSATWLSALVQPSFLAGPLGLQPPDLARWIDWPVPSQVIPDIDVPSISVPASQFQQ